MCSDYKRIRTPLSKSIVRNFTIEDKVLISGKIYCGRDAVLPRICELAEQGRLIEYGIDLTGSVVFHSAVSSAGLGPTSSNKLEIENSIPPLSEAGVKLHLGKGAISRSTIFELAKYNSVFALIPPITAMLKQGVLSKRIVAFPELGMEAFYELEVKDFPAMIAAAQNESIYSENLA